MLSLRVLIPNKAEQLVTVRQRDVVGSLRVFIAEKQEDVSVASLPNKQLFLRKPGNGIWLDNSNVFSSYEINPANDVLELLKFETPCPQPKLHYSCLKLVIPYYDYSAVFSEYLDNPGGIQGITVAAIKKIVIDLTLFNISPSDNVQLWYFWPHDHSLNQLPDNTLPSVHPNFHQLHSHQANENATNPHNFQSQAPFQTPSHILQATPPSANYRTQHMQNNNKERVAEHNKSSSENSLENKTSRQFQEKKNEQANQKEVDIGTEHCEECKREKVKYINNLRIEGDEALRRVLCTPHTHIECCVFWSPRVALLKSIKRRVIILVKSLNIYKTLVFQHRNTVQDALQLLIEFVQFTRDKVSEETEDVRDASYVPSRKRYALYKDGVQLEEDKLLAELLDPEKLWNRVICVFIETEIVQKQLAPPHIPANSFNTMEDHNNGTPATQDCHLLVLFRKQQAFLDFHLDPSITVGKAINVIADAFNIPPITTTPENCGPGLQCNIMSKSPEGFTERDGTSTAIVTPSSSYYENVIQIPQSTDATNSAQGSAKHSSSYSFSTLNDAKIPALLDLSAVSTPFSASTSISVGDTNCPPSNIPIANTYASLVKSALRPPKKFDNRHEYMLYNLHEHEWLDNDRCLSSYDFTTKISDFSCRPASPRTLPRVSLSETVPVELQLRPRPRTRRLALVDGFDFTIPLEANASAVLVYSPTTTVAGAVDEVQTLSGVREPSLELFVRYNVSSSSPPLENPNPRTPFFNSIKLRSPYFSRNGFVERGLEEDAIGHSKLYTERACLVFGQTLWSYNFLPTSTLEIFVEDEEKRDTEVLEEQALKAFGGHSTSLLPGEYAQHTRDHVTHFGERVGGNCATGRLVITNYRLIFHAQNRSSYKDLANLDDIDVPLCTIDKIKPLQFSGSSQTTTGLDITCKDMRNIMLGWRSDGGKNLINTLKKLLPSKQEDFFAFANKETYSGTGWETYDAEAEYKRLGLVSSHTFRLTRVNKEYSLCSSYPSVLVVPTNITDEMLAKVASFREKGRIPAVTWVHSSGASITRCSQPRVGLGRARCVEDEMLLKALSQKNKILYLIDSRPVANAMYNTIAGRGYEAAELYQNTKLIFLGIGNIHVMRESFKKLVDLCLSRSTDDEDTHWLSALESTNWMEHARVIIKSASLMVELIDKKNCSVVTHCSDGWDRTSQIVALAQLLLDPFYRSIRGFEILLEKDWLSFGHMFGARSGNWLEAGTSKENEFAPIFLLFLDAVYKVTIQFPTAFEFNENFLITVADAVYNCRFGTFLYNSEKERVDMNLKHRTVSLWSYIHNNKCYYTNPHYNSHLQQRVLFPSIKYPNLAFWNGYYLRYVRAFLHLDSADARMWQLIDENAALKAHIEKLQSVVS